MPRTRAQSALRAPLNEMLATEANVRLLRVLVLAAIPLGAGELAHRAQLSRTGVYPALANLERVGIIELVGAGATHQVELRSAHPLASTLVALFRAEAQRVESLVAELRGIFAGAKGVVSAWLEENQEEAKALRDADSLTCYLVGDPRSLNHLRDLVEDRLSEVDRTFQVHIEVVALSRSEVSSRVPAESLDNVVLLAGVPPKGLLDHESRRTIRNQIMHGDHDTRARLLAQAVAAKLRRDPSLVRRLQANITARMNEASEQERRELREWSRVISMPTSKLQRFLVEDSERAVRLRQSLPAIGLLTAREREEILAGHIEDETLEVAARPR